MLNQMVNYSHIELDRFFRALADPTRREIVRQLAQESHTISQLAKSFEMSLPAVLKHIKLLEEAGIVKRNKKGRENTLTINPSPLKEIIRYLSFYQDTWSNQPESIKEYISIKKSEFEENLEQD